MENIDGNHHFSVQRAISIGSMFSTGLPWEMGPGCRCAEGLAHQRGHAQAARLGETHGSQTRLIIHVSLGTAQGVAGLCWNMTAVYRSIVADEIDDLID